MKRLPLLLLVIFVHCRTTRIAQTPVATTFANPLLPSGADPWSIYKNGFYYYTNTIGDKLVIWKTANLAELHTAERKTIWVPPANTAYSKELWAPEIHYLRGRWYMYFAADNGNNVNHRLYVLENKSKDPMQGEWTFKGKIADATDKWAIDGSVFIHRGKLYMIWSGWQGDTNGQQDIYIARMKKPMDIDRRAGAPFKPKLCMGKKW